MLGLKFKQALIIFLFLYLPIWAIMSLTGCGGSENIPPASVLSQRRGNADVG